ncbi:MAG: type II toxin-antitoxin system ParD family antitoxin [Rhizonema sp. PD38]|nr:type II toxin-antitoxin system ParD family antitoxin [Rhizonema sp. PD38]
MSAPTEMEIPLTPQAKSIVHRYLAMGYSSATDVIEEALRRLDMETQSEGDWLRAEVQKGIASGDAILYDLKAIVAEAEAEFEAGVFDMTSYAIPQH